MRHVIQSHKPKHEPPLSYQTSQIEKEEKSSLFKYEQVLIPFSRFLSQPKI